MKKCVDIIIGETNCSRKTLSMERHFRREKAIWKIGCFVTETHRDGWSEKLHCSQLDLWWLRFLEMTSCPYYIQSMTLTVIF